MKTYVSIVILNLKPKIQDLEDRKVDKVQGYSLSKNDFTDALKTKLEGLSNYDDTELVNAINTKLKKSSLKSRL